MNWGNNRMFKAGNKGVCSQPLLCEKCLPMFLSQVHLLAKRLHCRKKASQNKMYTYLIWLLAYFRLVYFFLLLSIDDISLFISYLQPVPVVGFASLMVLREKLLKRTIIDKFFIAYIDYTFVDVTHPSLAVTCIKPCSSFITKIVWWLYVM